MAYKVIILYRLYMPSYVLGTFTEYPQLIFLACMLLRQIQTADPDLLIHKRTRAET